MNELREKLEGLKKDCNFFVYGRCNTSACYSRGGYKRGMSQEERMAIIPTCDIKDILSGVDALVQENEEYKAKTGPQWMQNFLDIEQSTLRSAEAVRRVRHTKCPPGNVGQGFTEAVRGSRGGRRVRAMDGEMEKMNVEDVIERLCTLYASAEFDNDGAPDWDVAEEFDDEMHSKFPALLAHITELERKVQHSISIAEHNRILLGREAERDELRKQVEDKEQLICDFQAAIGYGVDPDGITPKMVELRIASLHDKMDELRKAAEFWKENVVKSLKDEGYRDEFIKHEMAILESELKGGE